MNDINYEYDNLVEQMEAKVAEAIKALKEASYIANRIPVKLNQFDDWNDLKDAIEPFFDMKDNDTGWSSSSWCS